MPEKCHRLVREIIGEMSSPMARNRLELHRQVKENHKGPEDPYAGEVPQASQRNRRGNEFPYE